MSKLYEAVFDEFKKELEQYGEELSLYPLPFTLVNRLAMLAATVAERVANQATGHMPGVAEIVNKIKALPWDLEGDIDTIRRSGETLLGILIPQSRTIMASSVILKCDDCLHWFAYELTRGCMSPDGIIALHCPECKSEITMVDEGQIGEDGSHSIEIRGATRGLYFVWTGCEAVKRE